MLSLASDTPPEWVEAVRPHLASVLVDHAHCEKKAASTAMGLMFRYAERASLLRPLSELAREELRHFEDVLALLEARGIPFERQVPSSYAKGLHRHIRRGPAFHLLDTLLACALIEARSCERMKLLAEGLEDEVLASFYGNLLASEARHFTTYLHLAETFEDRAVVQERLAQLADIEARLLVGDVEPRLHGPFPRPSC